jgi:hypothetical protein
MESSGKFVVSDERLTILRDPEKPIAEYIFLTLRSYSVFIMDNLELDQWLEEEPKSCTKLFQKVLGF